GSISRHTKLATLAASRRCAAVKKGVSVLNESEGMGKKEVGSRQQAAGSKAVRDRHWFLIGSLQCPHFYCLVLTVFCLLLFKFWFALLFERFVGLAEVRMLQAERLRLRFPFERGVEAHFEFAVQ